ncbi:MAG: putative bifunctional diguanylate cyclase/phosphodiesterase, partial [Acidimicrobiales bacterium]
MAVTTSVAVASLFGASRMAGPWLALVVGLTAAAIVLIRRPGGVTFAFGRAIWSPWVLLAIGMAVASCAPLVEYRLEGAGVFTTPFGPPVYAVAGLFMTLGLLGLLRTRAPGYAFVLVVGESLVPLALSFLIWVAAIQLPSVAGYGTLPVTIAIASVAAYLSFVSVAGLLWRFDDEERAVFALLCGALWMLAASTGLEGVRSWLGGTVGARVPVAVAIAGLGLWLAAVTHESMGAGAEPRPTIPGALGDRRRFVIATLVLMTGPILIAEYARRGSIREPMWMAAGTAVVLALVTAYLLRLAGRAGLLEALAQRDELTGMALRTLFHDRLTQALARSRRDGTGLVVLFVDLDRFKQINDSLGHAAGNDVLRGAAQRIALVVGRNGVVGRVGGDEFTAFISDLAPDDDGSAMCAAIIEAFEQPFSAQRQDVFVTASVGAAVYPEAGKDADALLRNADSAMYKAKRRGRDAFEVYRPETNRRARDRVSIESRLHGAIDRGELRLHYQPKVGLRDGRMVGVEALLRWQDPREGLLLPGAFIHLAEESGLIVRLDEWALEEACRQAMAWQRDGLGDLSVAVNLSARDFRHRKVEDMVASVLRRTGLDPRLLELELTESLAKDDPDRTRATLLDLKDMGVHSSIDDFGVGYSSLSSLATLPFDRLKIDKSFVERIADGRQYALITTVIALGHGLDLEVTAEGVETVQQMEFLQAHGCDVMQGFLFSPALPADELERLIMLERVGNSPGRLQLLGADFVTPMERSRPAVPILGGA